jgi:transcriptional regulator GlxA family with amidase domain
MPTKRSLGKLCEVREFMRDCSSETLTLEELCIEADLSSWHFLRAFRDAFGETPHDFLTRIRIERAKNLLITTSRPVTEVCFDVGFSSLGSFSSLFRREVGFSPAQFRRQVRGWVTVPGRFPSVFVPFCFWEGFGSFPMPADPPAE